MNPPRSRRHRVAVVRRSRIAAVLAVAALSLAAAIVAGCGGPSVSSREPESQLHLDREDLARAERLFAEMQREYDLRRDGQAMRLGFELLDRYPSFARRDEVTRLAIAAAQRLGDLSVGRRLVAEFVDEQSDSPLLADVLSMGVDLAAAAGDTVGAADALIRLYDLPDAPWTRAEIASRLETFVGALDTPALGQLAAEYGARELGPYLSFLHVQALLRDGHYERAKQAADLLRQRSPDDRWTRAAEELLAAPPPPRGAGPEWSGARVPGRIGIICPLTGRYAAFGNAFAEGAQLAVEQVASGWTAAERASLALDLRVEDSEGDPVAAALAARRFCREGCSVLIGTLLSDVTAAVALVCDRYGVPLVSPTATHDRLTALSPWVIQTNQTEVFETEVLAQLATRVLLKRRFAILYPRGPAGERSAERFAAAVSKWGGTVVAQEGFARDATDFRTPIDAIRATRPEVLYVPASVDQMVLLGPQLDFYRAGVLVLGPSEWNSAKLRAEAATVMQRALFVSDTALFPSGWTADFRSRWNEAEHPPDATALALRVYQATRAVCEEIVAEDREGRDPARLGDALGRRLAAGAFEAGGPETFARSVGMILGDQTVPFPAYLYADVWPLIAPAESDSLELRPAPADTVTGEAAHSAPADQG